MRAIVYHTYGSPDVLHCEELDKPSPGSAEVLIKVQAAAVNPLDVGLMKGKPFPVRLFFGVPHPRVTRPGRDVAGVVEAVGVDAIRFKPGDEVFGVCAGKSLMAKADGAFAEYARTTESALALKPENVSFEEAAAVPIAALTALQGLRDKGKIRAGQKILINGAAGGVGTFAVQIAKAFGAEVTGVCSTPKVGMVRSIGADHVLDYTREDFTKDGCRYDLIFDCIGNHSAFACRRAMKPNAVFVGVGGPHGKLLGATFRMLLALFIAIVLSPFASRKLVIFMAKVNQQDLNTLRNLMRTGKVKPVIDSVYPLSKAADAFRHLDEGHAAGKVVITLRDAAAMGA